MQLLSTLNAGVAAAANGHAEIYVRGTATRATIYADFEGNGTDSSGANITLDAYGSALVYVNQLVDVVVKDEDGTTVRSYGDGYAAPNIEVRSDAFTGIHYDTAASAAGNPTNVKSILDLWLTNNGAIDWKILFNGSASTIQAAMSALNGVFFNVKTYGDTGDGVASDQAAFAAALAAAVAAGGGNVYVPPGTHRLTAGLTWDARVNLIGVPGQSIITIDHATDRTLTFGSASTALMPCILYGITFQTAQANTATVVRLDDANRLRCVNCTFNSSSTSAGIALQINTTSACTLEAFTCFFKIQSATLGSLTCNAAHTSKVVFTECQWLMPATFNGYCVDARSSAVTAQLNVSDCFFDAVTNVTSGTFYGVRAQNGTINLEGNVLDSGFTFAFVLAPTGLSVAFAEKNVVSNGTSYVPAQLYSVTGNLSTGSVLEIPGIIRTSITTTATVPNGHRTVMYEGTSTVPAITLPTGYFPGQRLDIFLENSSGTGWSFVSLIGTGILDITGVTYPTVGNLEYGYMALQYLDIDSSGTYRWTVFGAEN